MESFAKLAGGTGAERPDLKYLVNPAQGIPLSSSVGRGAARLLVRDAVLEVGWEKMEMSVDSLKYVIENWACPSSCLGRGPDRESALLVKLLGQAQFPHFSSIGKLGFGELASVLAGARAYFGNDTGLAHLAEAVGPERSRSLVRRFLKWDSGRGGRRAARWRFRCGAGLAEKMGAIASG